MFEPEIQTLNILPHFELNSCTESLFTDETLSGCVNSIYLHFSSSNTLVFLFKEVDSWKNLMRQVFIWRIYF